MKNPRHLIVALSILSCVGCGTSITIDVPRSVLDSTVDGYFPMSSDDAEEAYPVSVVLSDPRLLFDEEGNRLGLRVNVAAEPEEPEPPAVRAGPAPPPLPGLPTGERPRAERFAGELVVFGELSYEPASGTFHFTEPAIDVETSAPIPEQLREPVSKATTKMLSEYLGRNAVYTLEEGTAATAARMLLKQVRVSGETLSVTLGL